MAVEVLGATVKTLLKALLKPEALAVSCLLVPAASTRRSVKEAEPLPAAVPMSKVVVPCSGPVPEVKASVTGRLAGKPVLETFPNWSRVATMGCWPKIEPAAALPGCVTKAKVAAAAEEMEITPELSLAKAPLVNRIVMFVATLCDKFEIGRAHV